MTEPPVLTSKDVKLANRLSEAALETSDYRFQQSVVREPDHNADQMHDIGYRNANFSATSYSSVTPLP